MVASPARCRAGETQSISAPSIGLAGARAPAAKTAAAELIHTPALLARSQHASYICGHRVRRDQLRLTQPLDLPGRTVRAGNAVQSAPLSASAGGVLAICCRSIVMIGSLPACWESCSVNAAVSWSLTMDHLRRRLRSGTRWPAMVPPPRPVPAISSRRGLRPRRPSWAPRPR